MDETRVNEGEASLASLPPEIIFMILGYSLEANLIHGCRRLRNVLPPFVQWTKGLTGIAVCLSDPYAFPYTQYRRYIQLFEQYASDCGLISQASSRKREVRAAVFTSTWFNSFHLRATLLDIFHSMPEDISAFQQRGNYVGTHLLIPAGAIFRLGGDRHHLHVFRLDQFCVVIGRSFASSRDSLRIWEPDGESSKVTTTVSMPLSRTWRRSPVERKVVDFVWNVRGMHHNDFDADRIRDALVFCIMEKDVVCARDLLDSLERANQSDPFGGIEWKHVVLATRHGNAESLRSLLYRPIWPVWDAAKVKQLAYDIKAKQCEEWETMYKLLMRECKMQRSQEQYHLQQRLNVR